MHIKTRWITGLLGAAALTLGMTTAAAGSAATATPNVGLAAASSARTAAPPQSVWLNLTPSSPELAKCFGPKAKVRVRVDLTTDAIGFDSFNVFASNLPGNRAFTVFLLQQADSPFGAAEYIGDIFTDNHGNTQNTFKLIVAEAFSSNLLNGQRVRTELNEVGMWFADPTGDDFCLGAGKGPITPFDGDNEAGVQAFNSLHAAPLPAP